MPIDPVILHGDALRWPGEVDAPALTIAVDDLVLQLRDGQTTVYHRQPRFALHGRFCKWVGQRDQFAHRDDAAPAGLLNSSAPELAAAARCTA